MNKKKIIFLICSIVIVILLLVLFYLQRTNKDLESYINYSPSSEELVENVQSLRNPNELMTQSEVDTLLGTYNNVSLISDSISKSLGIRVIVYSYSDDTNSGLITLEYWNEGIYFKDDKDNLN